MQNDFTKLNSNIQQTFKKWENKILPHLPHQMDEMAKCTGAMQRKRGVCSSVDLLRMLFLHASSDFSFRILAVAACALGISAISDTAWRKRFSKAAPFLLFAFLPVADISAFERVKNVLLVDASVIRRDGGQQEQQRIHLCYSLNENRMKQVKVSDQHTAESLAQNQKSKMPYGKRTMKNIQGEEKRVFTDDYIMADGLHEAIVSEEVWLAAQRKREQTKGKRKKIVGLGRENLLTGILKCPECGSPMYATRRGKDDSKMIYYYKCGRQMKATGHECSYTRQLRQEEVNEQVFQAIVSLIDCRQFAEEVDAKLQKEVDKEEPERKIHGAKKN